MRVSPPCCNPDGRTAGEETADCTAMDHRQDHRGYVHRGIVRSSTKPGAQGVHARSIWTASPGRHGPLQRHTGILHKELYIRRRFQSEAGQDESWERAGDLEFGSQPMLKPKGNLQLQPCPYRKPRDHIQLLSSEDQVHSHSYVAKMRLTASTVSQLLRTIWD